MLPSPSYPAASLRRTLLKSEDRQWNSKQMSAITQRNEAISILASKLVYLSRLYKECFLEMGRGAMLIYASDVIAGRLPDKYNYRKEEEILDVFDATFSHTKLKEMINGYDYKNEGIMTLITSYSNATFFITVKLK